MVPLGPFVIASEAQSIFTAVLELPLRQQANGRWVSGGWVGESRCGGHFLGGGLEKSCVCFWLSESVVFVVVWVVPLIFRFGLG